MFESDVLNDILKHLLHPPHLELLTPWNEFEDEFICEYLTQNVFLGKMFLFLVKFPID